MRDEDILEEGRLTQEQELILYNMALRQDEYGRLQTHMLLSKLESDPNYQAMIVREYLAYKVRGRSTTSAGAVAQLVVTNKGLRYCVLHSDEIEPNRPLDIAGGLRG